MTDRSTLKALAEQWRLKAVQYRLVATAVPRIHGVNFAAAETLDECAAEAEPLILALLADLTRVEAERDELHRELLSTAELACEQGRNCLKAEAALATLRETHARLIPRAQVVQQQHAWLWDTGPEEIAHRQTCTDLDHAGCALVQIVESVLKAER